jgi:cysteine desulfurase
MDAYLDHAATGPMRPEAIEAMLPFLGDRFANPSGAHRLARDARRAIDEARDELAELVGASPGEIIFTSGGTESDNLAVFGAGRAAAGPAVTAGPADDVARFGRAVCSAIEHHAVLDAITELDGATVPVDEFGRLDLSALSALLIEEAHRLAEGDGRGVRLVSVMAVNNEVGTFQPLDDVARIMKRHAPGAVLHTDAVQAFCWTEVAESCKSADLVSMSAHKFGGPKGVGLLVAREGVTINARQVGGGQEHSRRSGTQNVAGIVAMAVAARLTAAHRDEEIARLGALRDRLLDGLLQLVPDAIETAAVSPAGVPDRTDRAAGIAHICFPQVESEALLFLLERGEIYASAASSCASGAMEESHVLAAIGVDPSTAKGSLRLSLGWSSTESDVDQALAVIPSAVERLRTFGI